MALRTTEGRKAQTSIIIILALAIFFAVVILFAWQRLAIEGPETGGVSELKTLLRERVEERIYTGTYETLELIGRQGGYLDIPSPSIDFGQGRVSYWQMCQHGFIPLLDNVTQDIGEGLKRYLNSWELEEFEGKDVLKQEINASDVEVVLSPRHIIARVWMHITIDGYKLDLPLEIDMDSDFLTLYNFASDFIQDNLEGRHLETFIASIFYHSYEDTDNIGNPNFLPNLGVLTECGQTIYKTWDEVARVISGMVGYSLGHIILWQNPPQESQRTFLKYFIPDVNGNQYPQYQVDFYPIGNLTQDNLQPSQNPVVITNSKVLHSVVPVCRKEYDVRYSWYQPVVVKFTDAVNYSFQFGIMPYIYQSAIGSCSVEMRWSHTENPCDTRNCQASIKALDSEGNPIEGVRINFGSCQIGKETDSQGIVEGGIPCGIAELNAYHQDYIYHYDIMGSSEIEDKTITLMEMPLLVTSFYNYQVSYEKEYCRYPDPFGGLSPGFEGTDCLQDMYCCNYRLDRDSAKDYVFVEFERQNPLPWELEKIYIGNVNSENETVSVKNIQYLPPGYYSTSSDFIETEKRGMTGLMEGGYELKEKPTTRDMYVNVPSYTFLPTFGFDTPGYEYYGERLLEVTSDCGIEHVTDGKPPEKCYIYTWCDKRTETRMIGYLQFEDFITLLSCNSGNKHLVLDPLLAECGLPSTGTSEDKVAKLEESCGKRVIFKTLPETGSKCDCRI